MLKTLGGPENASYFKTLGDRYSECGLVAVGGERGITNYFPTHFCSELEVTIIGQRRQNRLSLNSGVVATGLRKVRDPDLRWTLALGGDRNPRKLALPENA